MMTREGDTKIVNFMTFGEGVLVLGHGHISNIVKMHYLFKNFPLHSQTYIRQIKCIVMMTKEWSTKIVNYITPRAGVFVLRHGYISHFSENALFL